MDLGLAQAAERFPRLLEIIERYPETRQTFKENASISWFFSRDANCYSRQKSLKQHGCTYGGFSTLAILDSSIASFVFPALEKARMEKRVQSTHSLIDCKKLSKRSLLPIPN